MSEITAEISSSYPSLKAKMLELVEAAKAETRSLTAVAGGTSHKVDFKKTWQKTPNATKKQKWEKGGIDALEVFAGLSLINYSIYTWREKRAGGILLKHNNTSDTEFLRMDNAIIKGELRARKVLGMVVTNQKFDNWFGEGGRINYEINRFMPGGVYRSDRQARAWWKAREEAGESFRSKVSSELDSHESEIESAAGDVDVSRVERELERNSAEIADDFQSLMDRHGSNVKMYSNLRSDWGSLIRKGSIGLDELKSDLVDEAKALGSDVEKAAIADIADIVEAEENIIESE